VWPLEQTSRTNAPRGVNGHEVTSKYVDAIDWGTIWRPAWFQFLNCPVSEEQHLAASTGKSTLAFDKRVDSVNHSQVS
jgi:hypothetical protein